MSDAPDILGGARWRVVHGDCLDVMRGLPDGCVDAVVTDIPYGTGGAGRVKVRGGIASEFNEPWDHAMPLSWISEAVRVLADGGACVVFADAKRPGDVWGAVEEAGLRPASTVYWFKPDPPPNPRETFCQAAEVAVYAVKAGKRTWNGGALTRNVYECSPSKGADRWNYPHPTQKPVELMRWLVRLVVSADGIVLDPFAGSGTTGCAALAEARRCLLIERDAGYHAIAEARVREAARQGDLFR